MRHYLSNPIVLHEQGLDQLIVDKLSLSVKKLI